MVLQPGKLFVPKDAAELRDDVLTDMRLELLAAGVTNPPVQPNTDLYVLATAQANIALIQYANLAIYDDDSDVLTATGAALDTIREAYGLPVVPPAPSSGRVVASVTGGGAVTVVDGSVAVLPNGLRIKVSGTHLGVITGTEILVVGIDTGSATDLAYPNVVRWVAPPVNLETEARVSQNAPLTGGTDAETDERKRDRILNRLRNRPAGGNWAHMREISLNALGSVQDAYVYPALGGPASTKVTIVKAFEPDIRDFSRAFGAAALLIVRAALHAEMPSPMEIVVGTVTDEVTDVAVRVTIPDSSLSGGAGTGWLDSAPWPPLTGLETRVLITVSTDEQNFTVGAATVAAPIAGQTHVVWWNPVDRKAETRLVTAVAGGAGAWALTVDVPLADSLGGIPQVGDYVSPAAVSSATYGDSWVTAIGVLGPGENTADPFRLPRALRHPFVEDEDPSDLTVLLLKVLLDTHPEIHDIQYSFRSLTTPTVPGSVATNPNILVPRHFGVYQI